MAVKQWHSWHRLGSLRPYIFFAVLALVILGPLLPPGFILTLDMVFTPHIPLPEQVTSSYLFYVMLHFLSAILPGDLIQKILLFVIFAASGIGMYRLMIYLRFSILHQQFAAMKFIELAAYVAGVFYMVNPYVYSRFMAGQFAVLLGYACLPFFIKNFLQLLASPSRTTVFWLTGWLTIIGIVSIHTLALCAVIIIVGMTMAAWQRLHIKQTAVAVGAAVLLSAAASSYWITPLILGKNTTAQALNGFSAADQAAFATVGNNIFDQLINIAGLQGFWADSLQLYVLPQQVFTGWPVLTLGVWLLVVYGFFAMRQLTGRLAVFTLAIAAVAAAFLATAISAPLLAALPFAIGLREPHKFVGLVAIAFAVFAGFAVAALAGRFHALYGNTSFIPKVAVIGLALVPLAWTPTMLGGMYGQLQPREYPAEWYAINRLLNTDHTSFKVLFLPWHGYQRFDFAGRIIMSPADKFFDKPVLVSNQLEFRGAAPTFPDSTKSYITNTLLPHAPKRNDMANRLNTIGIKYIIVSHETAAGDYIANQPGLQPVFQTPEVKMYKNSNFNGR